jgi:hypothetical protein
VYIRILGPVYDNEKENGRILTNKEIYAIVKKPTITVTVRLNRLHWFGHVHGRKQNSPKSITYEFGSNKAEFLKNDQYKASKYYFWKAGIKKEL